MRYPHKYMKPGIYIITKHDKPALKITVEPMAAQGEQSGKLLMKPTIPDAADAGENRKIHRQVPQGGKPAKVARGRFNAYGCGCKKVEGKQLCPKHSRI